MTQQHEAESHSLALSAPIGALLVMIEVLDQGQGVLNFTPMSATFRKITIKNGLAGAAIRGASIRIGHSLRLT